ncbi:MAG: hypothetical protein E7051_00205 [Lentisphaerae bacterium]|nr:hypothetical protein [Lentisphaerota bacterium]
MSIAQSAMHLANGEAVEGIDQYQPKKERKKAVKTPAKKQRKHRQSAICSGIITETIKDLICEEIAKGKSLSAVCRDNLIVQSSVYSQLSKDEEFAERYARARERQADFYADEVIELADNCSGSLEDSNRTRLQIDARKWACGKLHPRKYSDKASMELSGKDGSPLAAPIIVNLGVDESWG